MTDILKLKTLKDTGSNFITVAELLLGDFFFRIPDYQRGYAWNEEFKDLWNDILHLYRNKNIERNHYTGMLALDEILDPTTLKMEALSNTTSFYIVDGQQRLTSIVIIIQALLEHIQDENEDFDSEYNNLLYSKSRQNKFGYSFFRNDASAKYFEERIFNHNENLNHANQYLANINNAKNFIDEALNKFDGKESLDLLKIVLHKLVFNIYFVTKDFDVRITFETMNNRGKKLSNLELLKNRLMYLSSLFPDESNFGTLIKNSVNRTWQNIYENLCLEKTQLPDDDYLKAHWIVYKDLKKNKGNAYIEQILKQDFSTESGELFKNISNKKYQQAFEILDNYISSLDNYSKYWSAINKPDETKLNIKEEEKYWIKRLARISENFYLRTTLMVVLAQHDLDIMAKIKFYTLIEQFIFVNKILAQDSNDLSFLITSAQSLMKKDEISKINKLSDLCSKIENHDIKITAERVKDALKEFQSRIFDKNSTEYYYGWNGLKYFLYEYNESLNFDNESKIEWYELNKVSIEHVLPQNPAKPYWALSFKNYIQDQLKFKQVVNSLGNLLLLSNGSENSSLSNYSYPTKRMMDIDSLKFAYIYGSRSAREIAKNEHWTAIEIHNRTCKLLDFIYTNWLKDVPNFSLSEWNEIKQTLLPFTPIENESEYQELVSKLALIDVTNERDEAKSKIKPKYTVDLAKQLLSYFDSERFITWENKSQFRYSRDWFVFKFKKDNISGEPIIFECATMNTKDERIKINYNYTTNEMFVINESCWSTYQSLEELEPHIQKYIKSFYRYLKNARGINEIPTWPEFIL